MASKLEKIVGSWAPLLEQEFKKPYMKQLHKKIEEYRKNILEGFEPKGDLFEVFKRTPLEQVKVVIVVDTLVLNQSFLNQIEVELRDGLDVNLTCQEDYWWLNEQGVMFLPRYLSWGKFGLHKEWESFTDQVILNITATDKPVLVVTSDMAVTQMLHTMRPYVDFISILNPWKDIDDWVTKHYKQEIKWSPSLST